ncbi:MAG: hydrogenase maturation nickel metallochaperone HypA [Candidatus Promineifilaceae bacterium]|nr:hydrogenase maturation nickel metallochaperone HypA [Candidatus Promineifilaceae bacterium]
MHELAVTESILEIALDYAERGGAARVTDLYLVVGQLSSIVDDSVQFYWDIVSKDSKCEGARLHFERIAAQMICLECDHTYAINRGLEACPMCESFHVRVHAGEEFRLESIEMEMAAETARSAAQHNE